VFVNSIKVWVRQYCEGYQVVQADYFSAGVSVVFADYWIDLVL